MKHVLTLMLAMVAALPALAANGQSDTSSATALDLSVPAQTGYSYATTDASGNSRFNTPYDPARRFAAPYTAAQAQPADTCDGKAHGSATVGVGYSNHLGNSNFQAAQLNTCKRYYDDNGNAHTVGVSIGIGQSNFGSGQRGWRGRGW